MTMLILPIKKKWFDMIVSGQKKQEYREIKKYYNTRLGNYFIHHKLNAEVRRILQKMPTVSKEVIFRNGYSYNSPSIKCICQLRVGKGKEEWGAEKGKEYYILEILEKEEFKKMITGIKIEFNENEHNYFENERNNTIEPEILIIALLETINDICKEHKLDTKQQLKKYIHMGSTDNYNTPEEKEKMQKYKTY